MRYGIGLFNWVPGFSEALWFEQTLIPVLSGVPDPASLALLGVELFGLAAASRIAPVR